MSYVLIRYHLKNGVDPADFEKWAIEIDHPTMRRVRRVRSLDTWRVTRLFMGEGEPQQSYFEVLEIDDFAAFCAEDLVGEVVVGIMAQFMSFADNPEFSLCEKLE